MILLLVFAIIVILVEIFFSITIKFEVKNLKISLPKINGKITNENSKVSLKIYILRKIKIAEINLKKVDLKNEKVRNSLQKQFKKNKPNLDIIKFFKSVNFKIEKMSLKIFEGTEDAAITAIGVGVGYTFISNFISGKIVDLKNIKYEILPVYQNKNILKLEFDSIITLNMENIIDIIKLLKKGRVDKNVRTSNRRAYAYSNE